MATIQLYQYFVVDTPNGPSRGGSLSEARSVNIGDDELIDRQFKVPPETSIKVFDAAEDEGLGNFDFMWIESDLDLLIQYTADPGVTDEFIVIELKGSGTAGQMGAAMVLGSDAALLGGTVDSFDGSAGTIEEIWVRNESATDTARLRLVVAT